MAQAKITAFDRATAARVREHVEKALASVGTEFGLVIKAHGGTFSPGALTMKIEFATVGDDGTAQTRDVEAFKRGALLYGLAPDDLGKTFRSSGRTFKITGLAARRSKRPIIATDTTSGKSFVFAAEDVRALLRAGERTP